MEHACLTPFRFGHGTKKLARMGKSMEKRLAHRIEDGLTEAVRALLPFGDALLMRIGDQGPPCYLSIL